MLYHIIYARLHIFDCDDWESSIGLYVSVVPVQYVLQKCVFNKAGAMQSCSKILDKVISFGHQDKFLYASVYSQDVVGPFNHNKPNTLCKVIFAQCWICLITPLPKHRCVSALTINKQN